MGRLAILDGYLVIEVVAVVVVVVAAAVVVG